MSTADLRGSTFVARSSWLRTWPWRYAFATAAVAVTALVLHLPGANLGFHHPFVASIPAVVLVAWLAGFWPGMYATLLSVFFSAVFFLKPLHSGANAVPDLVGLVLFSALGIAISALANLSRRRATILSEFERVAEHLEETIVVIDRNYRYVLANDAFLRYRGMKRYQVVGRHAKEVLNPLVFDTVVKKHLDECFQGKIVQYELQYAYPALGQRDLQISYFPIEGPEGMVRAACVLRDITEHKRAEEALRRSEENYRLFVAQSSEAIFRQDLDAPIAVDLPEDELIQHILHDHYMAECNDAMARMYGFTSAREFVGRRLTEMLDPNDPRNIELTREFIRSGFRVIDRESREVDIHGKAKVFLNSMIGIVENGKLVRTWGIQRDVTERVKLEEERSLAVNALRGSEAHFRILVEQASDGIFIADATGKYLDVNSAGAEMLGYTREEIMQMSIPDLLAPEEVERVAGAIDILASGEMVRSEWRFRRKDGSFFPGEVCGKRLPDGRLQGILRDMSGYKQAEDAIRRSEERFKIALQHSPVCVFNLDRDLRYTWIYNPQRFLDANSSLGKTDAEILGEDRAAPMTRLQRQVLETGAGLRSEISVGGNGEKYHFDVTLEPLRDAAGNIIGITGAAMDVARLRELADRLQKCQDKLVLEKLYLENEIQSDLGFEEIIGQSPSLRDVLKEARVVAPTNATVLLLGETGTGKELIARSIHSLSSRRDSSFIKLNCAAVPIGLLESELFGHEKGAFTGAVTQKVGRLELADKGTLFLDEIGELPLELQPKLLRVLQDQEFERLGGVRTLRVDVRIIAATNRDLLKDVGEKKFREDLFYRLHVFPIHLPALRERRSDIPQLVAYFLHKHAARMGKRIESVPRETLETFSRMAWPGNVRELENLVERLVILTNGPVLAALPEEMRLATDAAADTSLDGVTRDHLMRVLRETNGVLSGPDGAAARLGLKRTTLQSMLKRYEIDLQHFRDSRRDLAS